ncbi:MAG TPA: hypothetical protein VNJ07_13385, partial [Chitinophagales bacterium]|nr:hypothetical protein [Chitinophagales bacterium]
MLNKIIHTYWTRLAATVLVFISVVLTSRYLGADGKGMTSLITTNLLFINLVNEFIGGVSLIYLIPRRQPAAMLIPAVLFALLDSFVLAVFFQALHIVPEEYTVHIYFLAVLQTLNNTLLYVLLGRERVKMHNNLFLLKALINAGWLAVYFIGLKTASVEVFLLALYASNGIPLLIGIILLLPFLKENFRIGNILSTTRELLAYGSLAQSANIIQTLNYRLSFYLLNFFLINGKAAVGVFSVTLALCDVIWMMSKSIGMVQLTRIANTSDVTEAHQLTKKFLRFSVLSTLLFLIPAMTVPENFYSLLFGQAFGEVRTLIQMMGAGVLIFSVNIILSNHFAGTGRY